MRLKHCPLGIFRIPAMRRLICLFMVSCTSWINPALAFVDETPPAPDVEVLHADFGLFKSAPGGERVFKPSTVVPLKNGQHYGWSIVLRTSKPKVRWREEFTLPSPPSTWTSEEWPGASQTISQDRMTSIFESDAIPINGVIENIWEVAPGDPKGHYTIRVTIDGGNQQVFEFDLQE
jgi:hypothetical protein